MIILWCDYIKYNIFECHDILILDRSPIKWRQRPDMTLVVDWDVKFQFKQTKKQKKTQRQKYRIGIVIIVKIFGSALMTQTEPHFRIKPSLHFLDIKLIIYACTCSDNIFMDNGIV